MLSVFPSVEPFMSTNYRYLTKCLSAKDTMFSPHCNKLRGPLVLIILNYKYECLGTKSVLIYMCTCIYLYYVFSSNYLYM